MLRRYSLPILISQILVIAIFSILVFALGNKENYGNSSFIIAYVFVFVAVLLGMGLLYLVDLKKKHDQSINELPLFLPANIALFSIYFILAVLFLLIKAQKTTAVWVINFIILIIYIAYAFLMWFVIAKQSDNREHIRRKVNFIRNLQEELLTSSDYVDDASVKEILVRLSDDVRFSDPMSDSSLSVIEDQIFSLSGEIRDLADKKEYEAIKAKADELSKLLKERNRKCKILK